MNQIPIYQHPYVDVFKATKLQEWSLAQKEGDVQEIYDKELAKNVIKVSGVTSASNYFQVPASKNLPKKSLGLIGKYVYAIINVPAGKTFALHFDYMVNETRLVKINVSNIYPDFKVKINLISFNKYLEYEWEQYFDTLQYLIQQVDNEENNIFQQNQKHQFSMRSLQVTANIQIRGIFTSDMKYTVQTLPKDMQMKLTKEKDWFKQYAWFEYPHSFNQQEDLKEQENINKISNTNQAQGGDEKIKKQSILKRGKSKEKKSVTFGKNHTKKILNQDLISESNISQQEVEEEMKYNLNDDINIRDNNTIEERALNVQEVLKGRDGIEKTMQEIEELKSNYQYNLESKNILPQAQITLYQDQEIVPLNKISRVITLDESKKQDFILKPNPIMKIDRVIGLHPYYSSGQIFYNKDPKLSKEIIYTQANLLLGYYPPQQRQRLFYDHPIQSIEFLQVEPKYVFTASRSKKEESKDFEVSIWQLEDSQCLFTFKPPLEKINSITLSQDQEHLCFAGKDFQKRDLIIVYFFIQLIKHKKVEIYARQLSDFDIVNIRFNDIIANSLISCGKENIRFFKIKNNHLPAQSIILNNMGRGKVFNKSVVDFVNSEKNQGKKVPSYVYVTTNCGLLYFVNYNTRQIDQVIQIHEDKITSLVLSPDRDFCVTASINGILRLWSPDFKKLISEVNTQQPILSCDINITQKEIVILSSQGSISTLDLETSSYNILMRSHQDNIIDIAYNKLTSKLVTIGLDSSIQIWNSETMDAQEEFSVQNDIPRKIASNTQDCLIAVGYKSGFVRIFDLEQNKLYTETMIYESPIVDIKYSQDNRFLAVFYQSSKIVIFNIEKEYQPIKTIDYEFISGNYFSLSFSPDGKYLANISSNSNNVTIWETKNFSLKFHLDLTGDIISKIQFAPNGKDLVILTSSSKLKFYRIGFNELQFIKDVYGVADMECLDFEISPNNKYIILAGKEGVIKIYDYFMRGTTLPSTQSFLGHCKFPSRLLFQDDMRFIYSIGEQNGIFKWTFYGDKDFPIDGINKYYEEIEDMSKKSKKEQIRLDSSRENVFEEEELKTYTQQQIEELQNMMESAKIGQHYKQESMGLGGEGEFERYKSQQIVQQKSLGQNKSQYNVQYNNMGYQYEQYDIELKKVLSCSTSGVKNNLIWNKELRYIAYTSQNIVIIEDLNQEKTQRLLKEGNDKIYGLKMSWNEKFILAFTKQGNLDGFPCLYMWDAKTLKKVNQIAINDQEIQAIEFSPNSNMLLVISQSSIGKENGYEQIVSTISVWDFLEGQKDILCKSQLPLKVIDGRWNCYLSDSNEFVTISERKYHYWKIQNNLSLQYQEGDIPKTQFSNQEESLSSLEFVVPTPEQISVYLLIGLTSGYIWVLDSRVNQFVYSVKVLDQGIRYIYTSRSKIIIEGSTDTYIHCWPQGTTDMDKSDPNSFFMSREVKLCLDGFPVATCYDESGSECMTSSNSGSIWFLSWTENATIKLKSCHSPHHQINCADFKYVPPSQFQIYTEKDEFYQFDQNYYIASSGKDGILKLWNMFDSEFLLQFIVPKEECVTLAMHQFKPYMITSFTDGFLRFFELNQSKNLGRCQIYSDQEGKNNNDYIISLKILPSGNHILGASKNGQILLIFVQQWDPLGIKIESLASINTSIYSFDVSWLEPYNKWLVGTSNGKILVYNRKDFNAFQQEIFSEDNPPKFNFMDSFNLLDYVDNNFTESKRCHTLDHYYSIAKRNLVFNEVNSENESEGIFANSDLALYIGFIKKCNYVFVRNFELHQVVKKIELSFLPMSIQLTPNSSFFVVLQQDNIIKMIDIINEENTSMIKTIHEEAKVMKICPNGKYILTGGNKGDICLWSIKKSQYKQQHEQEYQ